MLRRAILVAVVPAARALAALSAATALDALHALATRRLVRVAETPAGRGLVATRDLAPGETAMVIPFENCLVEPDGSDDDHWASRLASRLVRGEAAAAHAAHLPPPPDVLPRWDDDDVEALGDDGLAAEADGLFFWRDEQWAAHCARHADAGSRDAFVDALDVVCSRTVRCGVQPSGKHARCPWLISHENGTSIPTPQNHRNAGTDLILAPLLDMANHDPAGGHYFVRDDGIGLAASDAGVAAGEPVTLNYGERNNGDWLCHYGFLPSPNRADATALGGGARVSWDMLPLPEDDPRRSAAAAAAAALDAADDAVVSEARRPLVVEYRLARRRLLAAASGCPPSSDDCSVFGEIER